jgi:hypothetical protein
MLASVAQICAVVAIPDETQPPCRNRRVGPLNYRCGAAVGLIGAGSAVCPIR